MNKLYLLISCIMLSLLFINLVNAQITERPPKIADIVDDRLNIYDYSNKEEYKIMVQNMNNISTQEMSYLGNYTRANIYQNKYNQTIVSVEKQSKFLNLFQWQRNYEYQIINGSLSYQPKWYDFLWRFGD